MYLIENYARLPVRFVKGKGVYLYDEKGKRYLDFIAGIGVVSLGHADEGLARVITRQAQELLHVSNLYENPWQEELAKKLSDRFWTKARAFFCNSGTEANETAIKLARKYWREEGQNRYRIITFRKGFHGRTYGSLSATAQEKLHKGFEPMLEGFDYAEFNDIRSVEKLITSETAGIMLETIQGEGGVNEADPDFLEGIQKICEREGLLLIVDEVQTGIGRTGRFYSYEWFNLKPDIITLAKGLGGGVPVGCVLAREEVAKAFKPGDHGSTFGGNPLACKSASYVVDRVANLLPQVLEVGKVFKEGLRELHAGKVKGRGLMLGLEIEKECKEIVLKALKEGLLINCTASRVLRFLPPLIVQKEHVEEALRILQKILYP